MVHNFPELASTNQQYRTKVKKCRFGDSAFYVSEGLNTTLFTGLDDFGLSNKKKKSAGGSECGNCGRRELERATLASRLRRMPFSRFCAAGAGGVTTTETFASAVAKLRPATQTRRRYIAARVTLKLYR